MGTRKTVVVTGAAMGMGYAIASSYAKDDFNLALVDINAEKGAEALEEMRKVNENVIFIQADVSNEDDVKAMVDEVVEAFGGIQVLLNIAGIPNEMRRIVDQSVELWDKVINTNLRGTYLCSKYAAPKMIEGGWGRIVNISSIAGVHPNPSRTAYGASKAGIIRLSEVMALEWAEDNITVNTVIPGMINTPLQKELAAKGVVDQKKICQFIPMGRYGTPEEIARVVRFFTAEESGYITGASLAVDGGILLYSPFDRVS